MQKGSISQLIGGLYHENYSASLIAKELGLSIKQVYSSLNKSGIKRRSTLEQNRIRFESSPLSYNFIENLTHEQEKLLVGALMLYSGEGAKTGNTVDIANSNENVLKTFVKFLREICGINEKKLRCYLYCFSNQNQASLIKFWSKELSIGVKHFTKPYIRKQESQKSKRIISHGVLHVRYSDKKLLVKILQLIEELFGQLNK